MKLSSLCLISVLLASVPPAIFGAVIGTNPPCPPLSAERIAALPPADQAAWRDYLARSAAALAADKKFYADELTALGLTAPLVPAKASGRVIPIKPPGDSFASVEARRLADHLVSFQTPAGGWNKNTDFGKAPRRPGERSGSEAGYVGTIDNAATVFPLYFLAAVINAASPNPVHRAAFTRGLDYLLVAQFPSGGWPQVYPLEGGYHDAITFNDGATVNVLTFLRACAAGTGDFAFVAPTARARAAAAVERGLACILATQIVTAARHHRRRPRRRRLVRAHGAQGCRLRPGAQRLRPPTYPHARRTRTLVALHRDWQRPRHLRRSRSFDSRSSQRHIQRTPRRLRVVRHLAEKRARRLRQMVDAPPQKVGRGL